MTDDQKVYAMFLIRTWECPELNVTPRVEEMIMSRARDYYYWMLEMFNERYVA